MNLWLVEQSDDKNGQETFNSRTMDTGHPERAFFKNPKLLGLGWQIGLKFYEAYGVFLAKLLALFWHCESIVHGKVYLVLFPTKSFGF